MEVAWPENYDWTTSKKPNAIKNLVKYYKSNPRSTYKVWLKEPVNVTIARHGIAEHKDAKFIFDTKRGFVIDDKYYSRKQFLVIIPDLFGEKYLQSIFQTPVYECDNIEKISVFKHQHTTLFKLNILWV